jgi:8-oxo-dGTP pyrophosphatase MutT (NUDIX family)
MKKETGRKIRAAGILLVSNTGKPLEFLLLRHANRWDLPKGHCEPGESFRQAALRETEEETGIPARDIRLDDRFAFTITYPVTDKGTGDEIFEKQVRYYLGFLSNEPTLKLTEHEGAKWFTWNPPHHIQEQTIDPLLTAVAEHLERDGQL